MRDNIRRYHRENDRQTAELFAAVSRNKFRLWKCCDLSTGGETAGFNDCADVLGERQCELCNDIADSWDSSSDPSVLTAEKVSAI